MENYPNTPIKRQYINALFEIAVYYRRRVETILNFLSFISIDIKGFSFKIFAMAELESYTFTFFLYFITQNVKKRDASTFKFCHFKPSEDFFAKIE